MKTKLNDNKKEMITLKIHKIIKKKEEENKFKHVPNVTATVGPTITTKVKINQSKDNNRKKFS